jgi:hypothetical protein
VPCLHRIAAGQALGFFLPEGSEVRCRAGCLQLTLAPLARVPAACGQTVALPVGQSWRAPQRMWVRLAAPVRDGGCLVAITVAAAHAPRGWRRLFFNLTRTRQ